MIDAPLVSIVMPAYNSAAFIEGAINSVRNQTYSNWELLIIDDASTDLTIQKVEDIIQSDPRIILFKNSRNLGPGESRNTGIAEAGGEFIAFLDSDDLWLPGKLEIQLKFLKEHNLAMCFSSYLLMKENGELTGEMVEALPVLTYQKLLKSNYVGNLTGIYDVGKIGKTYAPSLRKRQDWALWLAILKKRRETKGIQEPLAVYRIRKGALSKNKAALVSYNFRIYKDYLNYGFFKSCRYMSRFLWEHFMVKKQQVKVLNK
jgi:glycosyltransferase involved in cell wall biosynthesis